MDGKTANAVKSSQIRIAQHPDCITFNTDFAHVRLYRSIPL